MRTRMELLGWGFASPPASQHRSGGLPAGSRLDYARLGVHALVTHVRAVQGVMQIPLNPRTLGWWSDGSAPGDETGTVVVVGHVDYAGTAGAFAVLPSAKPGDTLTIDEPGTHDHRCRVDAVRTYPKSGGLPQGLFSARGPARLVLITCGGPFDTASGNYEDNIVVYATPA
jgi:hypothetical protein